jgi:hypothetical protein
MKLRKRECNEVKKGEGTSEVKNEEKEKESGLKKVFKTSSRVMHANESNVGYSTQTQLRLIFASFGLHVPLDLPLSCVCPRPRPWP